jgi:hypothetical protein
MFRLVSRLACAGRRTLQQCTSHGVDEAAACSLQQQSASAAPSLAHPCNSFGILPSLTLQQHFSSHTGTSPTPLRLNQATINQIISRAPSGIKEALSFAQARFESCVPPFDLATLNLSLYKSVPGRKRKELQKVAKKVKGDKRDPWLWQQLVNSIKLEHGMHKVWQLPLIDRNRARALLEGQTKGNLYIGESLEKGAGKGLFAARDIEAGTVLALTVLEKDLAAMGPPEQWLPCYVPLLVNDHTAIDTDGDLELEATKYVMNSCTKGNTAICAVDKKVFLVATRDLLKDDELLRSYSMKWWLDRSLIGALLEVTEEVQANGTHSPEGSTFQAFCQKRIALENMSNLYHPFEWLAQVLVGSLPHRSIQSLMPLPKGWKKVEHLKSTVAYAQAHEEFGCYIQGFDEPMDVYKRRIREKTSFIEL